MQVGIFRGSEGAYHDWVVDEETLPQSKENIEKRHRLITVVVQLQSGTSYTGGDLHVGWVYSSALLLKGRQGVGLGGRVRS